jgi:hypothetical protein
MRLPWWVVALVLMGAAAGCYVSYSGDAGLACETTSCGCYAKKHMVFVGRVVDGTTSACVPFKLVRLRDRDGTVPDEDNSRSDGTYRVEGEVERSPRCVGGEPTVRDEPADGQSIPTYTYLPQRTAISDGNEQVDLLRFPFGTLDAGAYVPPTPCLPPPEQMDAGVADGG